jgi:hypothetical protein
MCNALIKVFVIILLVFTNVTILAAPEWPASITGTQGLGVSVHWRGKLDNHGAIIEPLSIGEIEKQIKPMAEMGVKIIREDNHWQWTDKDKGTYNFEQMHLMVDVCEKYGLKLLVILAFADPQYEKGWSISTPQGADSYAKFCAKIASEFKSHSIIWEMWNEANLSGFWSPKSDALAYSQAIQKAAKAMRDADPNCIIVAPSTCTFDMKFLETCMQNGILNYISAVSIHPYSDIPETQLQRYLILKNIIDRYAPAGKRIPIVCSEWGFSRLFPGSDGNRIRSQDEQAALIVRSILVDQIAGVPMHILYTNLDYKNEDKFEWHENHFGLLTVDGKPKAAYQAVKTLAEQLKGLKLDNVSYGNNPKTGENLEGDYVIVFNNSQKNVIAAWTTRQPHAAAITLPASPDKILDMKGSMIEFSKEDYKNGSLKIELKSEPVYVLCVPKSL